mmetsp:Transcript_52614/g.149965  ORF Transcript_52614/g.149965 Transcript_52614/m.149965 type:complete len:256 (+) Transcript_52614:414-1181(+)
MLRGHVWKWSRTTWIISRTFWSGPLTHATAAGDLDMTSFCRTSNTGFRMSWSVVRMASRQSCKSTGRWGVPNRSSPTPAASPASRSRNGMRSAGAVPAWTFPKAAWQMPSSLGRTRARASSGLATSRAAAESGASWPSPQQASANSMRRAPNSSPPAEASAAALAACRSSASTLAWSATSEYSKSGLLFRSSFDTGAAQMSCRHGRATAGHCAISTRAKHVAAVWVAGLGWPGVFALQSRPPSRMTKAQRRSRHR